MDPQRPWQAIFVSLLESHLDIVRNSQTGEERRREVCIQACLALVIESWRIGKWRPRLLASIKDAHSLRETLGEIYRSIIPGDGPWKWPDSIPLPNSSNCTFDGQLLEAYHKGVINGIVTSKIKCIIDVGFIISDDGFVESAVASALATMGQVLHSFPPFNVLIITKSFAGCWRPCG